MTDLEAMSEIRDAIRSVRIGPFGPNALTILNAGGTTHLNGGEIEAIADALLAAGLVVSRDSAAEVEAAELLVLQVFERGEWVTQVGYSWTPDEYAKAHDKAETSNFRARVIPVYSAHPAPTTEL